MTDRYSLRRLTMRGRLTLWYAAALTVVAVGLALAGYVVARGATLAAVDETITEVVTAVTDALELEARTTPLDGRSIPLVLKQFRFRDMAVAVLDLRGDTLYASTDLIEGEEQPSESVRVLAARASPDGDALSGRLMDSTTEAMTFTTIAGATIPMRAATVERPIGGVVVRVGVLRALTAQRRILGRIRIALAGGLPVLILLAAIGGNLIARAGLRPIGQMADRASQIGAATLHERLPVHRPDDEPGRLALAFNALLARLDAAFDQQRQFVADASHELRTPVSIVSGEAQLALARDRSPEELRAALRAIRREAERLQHIVGGLFLLARADAGEPMLSPEPLYLGELAAECVESVASLAAARAIKVEHDGSVEIPMRGDVALLRRLILNLLDNAIKYTSPGGTVTVSAKSTVDANELRVIDSGPGIPPAAQPHLFDRFYRGRREGTAAAAPGDPGGVGTGAGLGLAIARWIAEAHGGSLSLEHSSRDGSTFLVRLPRVAPSPAP